MGSLDSQILEVQRDWILDEIEDLNVEIYEEIKAIERLEAQILEASRDINN